MKCLNNLIVKDEYWLMLCKMLKESAILVWCLKFYNLIKPMSKYKIERKMPIGNLLLGINVALAKL